VIPPRASPPNSAQPADSHVVEILVFFSLLAAALALGIETALPLLGVAFRPGAGADPLGLSLKSAAVFSTALYAARRLPRWAFAAGFFIGVFSSTLYEMAMIFGVLSLGLLAPDVFFKRLLATVTAAVIFGALAGLIAALQAHGTRRESQRE